MATITGVWLMIQTPTTDGVSSKNASVDIELQINGGATPMELDTSGSDSTSLDTYNQLMYHGWATQFYWLFADGTTLDTADITSIDIEVENDYTIIPRTVWVMGRGTNGKKYLLAGLSNNDSSLTKGTKALKIPLATGLKNM